MAKAKGPVMEYRNYYLPVQFPVLLLSGDYWRISDVPSGRLHFHNCLEIGICHSDSGFIEFSGRIIPFKKGDVTVIPKNVPHTTYSTPGTESHWSYLFVDLREMFHHILPASWDNYDLTVYSFEDFQPLFGNTEHPRFYRLAADIIAELESRNPGYQLSVKGLLLSLYIEILRNEPLKRNGSTSEEAASAAAKSIKEEADNSLAIAPALEYIEINYMHQFTIEHLANLCHWSPTHFRRVFHEIMGVPPLDYLNNTRVAKACGLLRSTEESILNISEMVGFRSVSSLNRYFLRIMRMSPRDYRKQMRLSADDAENRSILEYSGWMYPEK